MQPFNGIAEYLASMKNRIDIGFAVYVIHPLQRQEIVICDVTLTLPVPGGLIAIINT
jgi:hypothetical protein